MIHKLTVERDISITKIALTGKLRSGKDEVAKHLYLAHNYSRFAFGDALKETVSKTFPWLFTVEKPRALLQQYGQLMRQIDEDVWIKHVERSVKGAADLEMHLGNDRIGIVVTDVRQQNELDWCRANGFTIIRVSAPDELRIDRARMAGDSFDEATLSHETELAVDGFEVDFEIINDGNLDDLSRLVDEIIAKLEAVE